MNRIRNLLFEYSHTNNEEATIRDCPSGIIDNFEITKYFLLNVLFEDCDPKQFLLFPPCVVGKLVDSWGLGSTFNLSQNEIRQLKELLLTLTTEDFHITTKEDIIETLSNEQDYES